MVSPSPLSAQTAGEFEHLARRDYTCATGRTPPAHDFVSAIGGSTPRWTLHPPESGWRAMAVRPRREASRSDSGYPADGVDHTLSTLIFNRVLNAARYSSPIPMLTA